MENFKKDLNDLLGKYPELPAFTLTIQPRIVIKTEETKAPSAATPVLLSMPHLGGESKVYVSPQAEAMTAAEQTMAALRGRAGIKTME